MRTRINRYKWKIAKCREFRILGTFGANIDENLLFWKLTEKEHEKLEMFSVLFASNAIREFITYTRKNRYKVLYSNEAFTPFRKHLIVR